MFSRFWKELQYSEAPAFKGLQGEDTDLRPAGCDPRNRGRSGKVGG